MPLDFSDSADNFVNFGGTSFSIVTDPTDSGNDVGRIVNTGGEWARIVFKFITFHRFRFSKDNYFIFLFLQFS